MLRSSLLLLTLSLCVTATAKDEPVLQLVAETKLATVLERAGERFEASAVFAKDGQYHVLCDNRRDVAVVSSDLTTARLLPITTTWRGTDYEGLTYVASRQRFFAVIEAERVTAKTFRARLIEFDTRYRQTGTWSLAPDLADPGKGMEGLAHVERGKRLYLLALLEGNHGLGGKQGKDKGNGRVRVYEQTAAGWGLKTTLHLPPTAKLSDYAGIDVQDDRIVVVSQKTSKVWVGKLARRGWKVQGKGVLYRLPRPKKVKIYESVEGVSWVSPRRLVLVSDGARSRDGLAKSESIHLFDLP